MIFTTDIDVDDLIVLPIINSTAYFQVSKSDIEILKQNNFDRLTANFTLPISYSISDVNLLPTVNESFYSPLFSTLHSHLDILDDSPFTTAQLTIYHTSFHSEEIIHDDASHSFSTMYTSTLWVALCAYSLNELQSLNHFLLSNDSNFKMTFDHNLNATFSDITGGTVTYFEVEMRDIEITNIRIDTESLYSNPSDGDRDNSNGSNNSNGFIVMDMELVYIFSVSAAGILLCAVCLLVVIYRRRRSPMRYKLSVLEKSLKQNSEINYVGTYNPPYNPPKSPVMGWKPRKSVKLEMQLSREDYPVNESKRLSPRGIPRGKSSYNELMVRRDSLSEVAHRTDSNLHVPSFDEHDEYLAHSEDEELMFT